MPRRRTVLTPPPPPRATKQPTERPDARSWSPADGTAYRVRVEGAPAASRYTDDLAEAQRWLADDAWEGRDSILERAMQGGYTPWNPKPVVFVRDLVKRGLARPRTDVTRSDDGTERSQTYYVISPEGQAEIDAQWRP